MLDDISHPMSLPQLPTLTLLPKLHDPFLSNKLQSPVSFDRPHEVDALVKRCEASLRRLSTLTHSFQPLSNMSTVTLVPHKTAHGFDDYRKTAAVVTVTELVDESQDTIRTGARKAMKPQPSDNRSRKWKVSKPSRPVPSRTNSGLSRKSGSARDHVSDEVQSRCSCDTAMRGMAATATSFCDMVLGDPISPTRMVAAPLNEYPPTSSPDDSNICRLLDIAIATKDDALTQSCINYLREGANYRPLITIRACTPFVSERRNVPSSVAAQIRSILHEAVPTLLDDYPDYDCGDPSSPRWAEYIDLVPPQMRQMFASEWCRYVRRIKSFHENSPWDDFDYDHTAGCPHKDSCELYTRVHVRDAWNQFWRDSILTGNRCVPKPSQVAQFLCTFGNDLLHPRSGHPNQPNIYCVAGFKEELVQTLECLGGDNARYNWRWLGENMFKQKR
ncbi:hypothetical protein DRE_03228 [Drechslerella stenobrocha 248]|uniref:Uncharacterized protein n=1 Tax=Drechslerella stenobrocha 248 TaxID=1043628 RepID=W7I632_9PEZI|nr:hypothetical protein DRE_03228 [Drechslerella stenobrocha 248]